MWKPVMLFGAQILLFFSIILYIGLDGSISWISGTIALLLALAGFIVSARAINKEAAR